MGVQSKVALQAGRTTVSLQSSQAAVRGEDFSFWMDRIS